MDIVSEPSSLLMATAASTRSTRAVGDRASGSRDETPC
jgi:hypothetical protein